MTLLRQVMLTTLIYLVQDISMTEWNMTVYRRMAKYALNVYENSTVPNSQVLAHQDSWIYSHDVTLGVHVLSIRGTDDIFDILSDLWITPHRVGNISFHRGFWILATRIHTEVPFDFHVPIIITGHSLGAAITSILVFLLTEQGYNVSGYGFATPPHVAMLKDHVNIGNFTSFVYRDDIVPRLTVHSAASIMNSCEAGDVTYIPFLLRFGYRYANDSECQSFSQLLSPFEVQYIIPGIIMQLDCGHLYLQSYEKYQTIVPSSTCVADHSMIRYSFALGNNETLPADQYIVRSRCPCSPLCVIW